MLFKSNVDTCTADLPVTRKKHSHPKSRRFPIAIKPADEELLQEEAARRSQPLIKFISELLEARCADLRGCDDSSDRGRAGGNVMAELCGSADCRHTARTYRIHLPSGRRLL